MDRNALLIELHDVLATRHAALRLRLGVATAIALSFMAVVGWQICLGWGVFYVCLQLAEDRWLRSTKSVALIFLSLAVSSITFGFLAMTGPFLNGAWGLAAGVCMICGALLNTALGTLKSKAAFLASYLPFSLLLVLLPLGGFMIGAEIKHVILLELAVGFVSVMGFLIWRTGAEALAAEARARAQAEAADAAKSAFVAMVSHELRTPISAMLAGAAEAAGAPTKAERQANLDVITDAARMMRTLLNDLLDLSKLEAGRMTIESVSFDLNGLIDDCVRFWGPEARKAGLEFRLEKIGDFPAAVGGDPTRIRQILNNLLSNALKFTSAGHVSLLVSAMPTTSGSRLSMTVADSGEGMTAEQASRLFNPFTQADASVARTHGGTGLGLSISRDLARLMGGDLTATSILGQGSRFELVVDLQAGVLAAASQGAAPSEAPLSILVADDHPMNRKAMELILTPTGAQVTFAENGLEAIEHAATTAFDLVFLDLNMPKMGGLEAARRLRELHGSALPILALTGSVSAVDNQACTDAGMNGLVSKPVEAADIYAAIERALSPAPNAKAA